MTASSRSSGRRSLGADRLLAIAVLALWGLSEPAAAQVGQPVQLVPQTTPDYGTPQAAPEEGAAAGQPNAPQGFEITPLEAVGADYAGTLEPDNGGLGIDMWRGTDRVRVERLLPLLKPTSSPILAELTRRLVLSNAASPAGKGSGASLLPARARLLADMGLVDDAVAMLKLLPADQRDAASARLLVELSWRAGNLDGACAAVQESVPRVPVDSFWQEATIFCQLHAGQSSEATLGLDLLREQGEGDEAFFALADALDGNREAKVPPLPVVTPLYLAMAHAAGVPLPAVAIREPPPLMLALVAESPDAAVEQRLTAAETAAAAGVLTPSHLIAVYTAEPEEEPGTLDTALDLPSIGTTPATRAILYQAAVHAGLPQQRAQFIQKALETDTLDGNYWARLQIYLPLLADIAPAPELSWFAADAARHLYAGGKLREAEAWIALIQQAQQADPDVAAAVPQLQSLDYLAGNAGMAPGTDPQSMMPKLPPGDPKAERVRALFNAMQEPPETLSVEPQVALVTNVSTPAMPQQNVNLWLDLGEAAAKNRIGETVLLSLVGLNATGLADAEPEWLTRVVTSLRRVGLEDEARRLAVEAAIANGL